MLTATDRKLLINDLKQVFATKSDFNRFATKDDLKRFATKDDLKGFATKDDLKGFATKDDLKGFATKEDFAEIKRDLRNLKEEVSQLPTRKDLEQFVTLERHNEDIRMLLVMMESNKEELKQDIREFRSEVREAFSRVSTILTNHELRITRLEE